MPKLRYLVFAGLRNSAQRGWDTYLAHFYEQPDDVNVIAQMANPSLYAWYQVVDLDTGEIIAERDL
jgi:hypothetical protein